MSIVSEIVARLIGAGTPPEVAAVAVAEAFAAGAAAVIRTNPEMDRRREYDRERKRFLRETDWSKLRAFVLNRDAHVCAYCCDDADHVDHIVPICQGGGNDLNNLTAACGPCNLSKGKLTPEQWSERDGFPLPPWFLERIV